MEKLKIIQFFLPLFWVIGYFFSNLDQRKVKIYSILGAVIYFAYTLRLILGQENLDTTTSVFRMSFSNLGGLAYSLSINGFNVIFIALNALLLVIAILGSFNNNIKEFRLYYSLVFLFAWCGNGIFMSENIFTFYLFFEVLILPLFLLMSINNIANGKKLNFSFFIFSITGSIFMLISIIFMSATSLKLYGNYDLTIEGMKNLNLNFDGFWSPQSLVFWSFCVGLLVKTALVPMHSWLKETLRESDVVISILVIGIFIKIGIFGVLKFVMPVFVDAIAFYKTTIMYFGAIVSIYSAILCISQKSIKGFLVTVTMAHTGWVVAGIFAQNEMAISGVIFQTVAHSLLVSGFLLMENSLQRRVNAIELDSIGGLIKVMPVFSGVMFVFLLGFMDIPLLCGFPGRMLSFWGIFQVNNLVGVIIAISVAVITVHFFKNYKKLALGEFKKIGDQKLEDLDIWEMTPVLILAFIIIFYGVYPSGLISIFKQSISHIFI